MSRSSQHTGTSVPCCWDTDFAEYRHQFYTPTENITSEESMFNSAAGPANTSNSDRGLGSARTDPSRIRAAVAKFMGSTAGWGNSAASNHEAEVIAEFCRRSQTRGRKETYVALVYQWENKPGRPPAHQWGEYPRPLTHEGLHEKLCQNRYVEPSSEPGSCQGSKPEEVDADRRIIYINNLDPLTISTLASTTSRLETPAIQRTIFKHLAARTNLEVYIATSGFKTFSLELNISYFCLAKDRNLNQYDQRQRWDGAGPLRKSLACPVRPGDNTRADHPLFILYETHLSIAVTGVDHWRWTAWGFADSWFEPEDSVSTYYDGEMSGSRPDPLSNGQLDVTPAEWRPRQYFLRLLEIQIGRIAKEWEYILYVLEQEVHAIGTNSLIAFPKRSFQSKDGRERVRKLAVWNSDMIQLVGTLLKSLSQTLVAWETFQKTDTGYFVDTDVDGDAPSSVSQSENLAPSLRMIEKTFLNLNSTHKDIEQLKMTLEDLRAALARGEENYSTFVQQRTGEHVKLLTWVTIFWSPVVIATGMCSAQEGIFPFRNNIWDFFASLLIVSALVGLTIIILLRWQNSNLLDWKILLSSSDTTTTAAADDIMKAVTSITGPQTTSQERGRRRATTSFASSSRTIIDQCRRWTAGSGISSSTKSLLSNGLELGGSMSTSGRDDVGGLADGTGMPLPRTYHRAGKGYGTEEPHIIL